MVPGKEAASEPHTPPWPCLCILSPKRTLKESSAPPAFAFTFYLWHTVFTEIFWANGKSIFMRLLVSTHSVYQDFIGSCRVVPVTTSVGSACQGNYTTCPWCQRRILISHWGLRCFLPGSVLDGGSLKLEEGTWAPRRSWGQSLTRESKTLQTPARLCTQGSRFAPGQESWEPRRVFVLL